MTTEELFKKHEDLYLKFDEVKNKRSKRLDLHAFLLIDELFPDTSNIVSCADHDQIYLYVEYEDIEKLTEENVIELRRCGVLYDSSEVCLIMYV